DMNAIIARLPAMHRVASAASPAVATVDQARALVGRRETRDADAFALATAIAMTGAAPPPAKTGAAFVAWARDEGAWAPLPGASLAPGDIVAIDDRHGAADPAPKGAPSWLLAVALGTD